MPRPYVRSDVDWVDQVLEDWAKQVRLRPRETTVVPPGGRPMAIHLGGPLKGTETALGRNTRPLPRGQAPQGYVVIGLRGPAATADHVMNVIHGINLRCMWVLRAEYGLVDALDRDSTVALKAKHLGAYLDGRPWPSSAYADRLKRGMEMFATGYLSALRGS